MAYISGKYKSATSYTVTLGDMKIGTVYAILVQDLNTDGSSNGFICKWKSGATSSIHTKEYSTTAAYSQYDRRIGFFQGSFNTDVGTIVSDANFEKWADGKGVISAWNGGSGGGGSTTYTIGVNANGGTYRGPTPTVSSTYPYLSLTAISNSTSRNEYKLTGWLWSVDGTVYSTTATISGISSSGTLTAQWERTTYTYTIGVNANGGTYGGPMPTVSSSYPYLSLTAISNSTSRSGYKLTGWLWSVNGTVYSTTATISGISSSGTLTAQWEQTVSTITLYGNGGLWGGNLQKRTLTKNVGETVSFADYGPNGTPPLLNAYHSLSGWGTSAAGTAAWGVDGYVTVGATDADYYAIWRNHIDPFYWDGGNGTKDSSIIATGLPVTNITAERWNRLKAKVKEISAAKGVTYSYAKVSKGDGITSTEYNGVRNAIYNVPGHGTLPPAKARNTQILASLFNGTQSLKSALNAAIISYNNS